MLRPHGSPQSHLLRNATMIVMFSISLNRLLDPFELIVFGVTLRFWQLRLNTTGKSSHLLIYPYVGAPWGSRKSFVTECHHNSSIPYVPGNVLIGIRTKSFWYNTLILAVVQVNNRKSSYSWYSRMLAPRGAPQNRLLRNVTIIVRYRMYQEKCSGKRFWCDTLNLAVVPVHNRKSSHFLGHPYAQTVWGYLRPFVTECHHNSYIPYVS